MASSPNIFSTGQMRAQSISLRVSNRSNCNAGCQFCISRTTPGNENSETVERLDLGRLDVGLNYAKALGATHVILTGKADPTQEPDEYLCALIRQSRAYLPLVDMHTNGFLLQNSKRNLLEKLADAGLTMATFSIASFDEEENTKLMRIRQSPIDLIAKARYQKLLVRCSLVLNKQGVKDFDGVMNYIRIAGDAGAQMVVIREVWVPEVYAEHDKEVYGWNKENKIEIKAMQEKFLEIAKDRENPFGIQQRDPLPWGTPVFAIGGIFRNKSHGVNVTFAICDETTSGCVIKSIVHDDYGYRTWAHKGDILY